MDYRLVMGIKLLIAMAFTAVLLWDWLAERRGRQARHAVARGAALAVLGLAAFAGWWNFGQFHFAAGSLHYHEFFHYYLGSKYSPELGYTGLYDCVAAADVEQGYARQVATRWIRDLKTNELRRGSPILQDPDLCRSRFSAERWRSFAQDVRWFRASVTAEKWSQMSGDHGYNATPLWNVAGYLLSNTGPATWRQIRLLSLIDPALLVIMWAAIWWAFGWRVACVAAAWWGTNYPARYTFVGGAFLRQDWLLLSVAGLCFAKRRWHALSGAALAWAALLRIFPGFILLGLGLKAAVHATRARTVERSHLAFAGGAALAVAVLFPISLAVGHGGVDRGFGAWQAFAQNSRKHLATPLTNNVGLPMVISTASSSRSANVRTLWLDSPWDLWGDARRQTLEQRRLLYYVVAAAFVAFLGFAVQGQEDWIALTLGVGAIPFLTDLTSYYYGIFLAFAFLWPRYRSAGISLCLCSALTCLAPAIFREDDDRHVAVSVCLLVLAAVVTAVVARRGYQGLSTSESPCVTNHPPDDSAVVRSSGESSPGRTSR